tara:strand:- start:17 stop:826 length:810 start_codon:yes stop_codon:yes gene_type:complete
MPIAENYTALERAVFECACAGCESIWITVNDDWMPLVRKRIGEYVYDPIFYYRQYEIYPSESKKIIPVFFVPHLTKYRDKKDSLGWGIINSALYAQKVSRGISELVTPDMFYAAFPFGIYDPRELLKHRSKISSKRRFFLSHQNKTIKDGKRVGFSFNALDVSSISNHVDLEGTGVYKQIGEFVKGDPSAWSVRLPAEEQYSARRFSLEKVFEPLSSVKEDVALAELAWYYDVSIWDNYRQFLGSEHILKRPKPLEQKSVLHPIGVDDD